MLRLARLWKNLVDVMRPYDKSWHLDMYAAIIAARRLDIVFTVERNMIGNSDDGMEPWDLAMWGESSYDIGKLHSHDPLTMQVAHYCQTYSISSYRWSKHDHHHLDIRKCDPLNNAFNMPTTGDSVLMTEARGEELAPMTDVTKTARNVWLLDATMAVAQEAIENYNAEFCIPSEHTETLEEMPPSSLDLDCSRFGGPSDQSMQYWKSATQHDLSYKSHYWSDSGDAKYLTFDPGYEGWNNARLYFGECLLSWHTLYVLTVSYTNESLFIADWTTENVLVLAHATGRTLVLPPRNELNHLKGTHSFEDFFNIDAINTHQEGINIISMEEFLHREALPGKLYDVGCTSNDCALLPPESRIDWNGHNLVDLYMYLERIGTVPEWNTYPLKCALVIPGTDSYGNANENHLHKVDSKLPICTYNSNDSRNVLHLSTRILAPFYSFILFEDESQGLFAKRFIRDFLHYNDEVLCGSARIIRAIEHYAVSMGFPTTEFYSMHIRRGDFSIQYPEGAVSAEDLVLQTEADGIPEKKLVYIATDEKDKAFFQPFKDKYHVVFLDDFADHFKSLDSAYYGLLDQLVASKGEVFFGTWPSTFSSYINRLRGYYSIKDGIETGGKINSFYFSKDHKHIMMEYKSVDEPSVSWMREYPDAWYLIDQV